jgi:hypothetical protein
MKYLFFDCECANCYDHEGKICSFGYVITDESFRLLEEKDIIINPNAPFDPHVLGQGTNSIDLAYTPLRFQTAEKFPYHYQTIVSLLTDPDTKVFGYAIENDIGFLISECRRYNLAMPNFDYCDIQEIYRLYANYERSPSMEDGLKDLKVPYDDFEGHESKDDAKMSMLLLKAIIEASNTNLEGLLQGYPSSLGQVALSLIQDRLDHLPPRQIAVPYDREAYFGFNHLIYSWVDDPIDNHLEGYGFIFSPLLRKDSQNALKLGEFILSHRGYIVRNLRETSYYVVYDEEEKKLVEPFFASTKIAVISVDEVGRI